MEFKMSKTKTILAARKGKVSDEPLKFEYCTIIDAFELFNIVGGGTEGDTAELLLDSPDFLKLKCFTNKNNEEILNNKQLLELDDSKEFIIEFLEFLQQNHKDINNYFNGIPNEDKRAEDVKETMIEYAVKYSKYFFRIRDILSTDTARMLELNETLFTVQINTMLWANKKIMDLEAENKALIGISNEIIGNMQNKIELLELELVSKSDTKANKKLKHELNLSKQKIAELEKQISTQNAMFDSANGLIYPPDLDLANKIWRKIYIEKDYDEKATSHNYKFIQAAKKLGLDEENKDRFRRIKVITTPKQNKESKKNQKSDE